MSAESEPAKKPAGPSQATKLVQLAADRFWFAMTEAGEPVALEMDGPNIARPLRGGRHSLRAELAACYANQHRAAPSQSALADALMVLEGRAAGETIVTNLRVGEHDGRLILDLGDETGRCIIVDPGRWWVAPRSPITFRRTEATATLPTPVDGGTLDELHQLTNVSDDSWPLVVAALVAMLFPTIPHPVLTFLGEHGTGKTTTARTIVSTIDPSPAPVRSCPRSPDDWAVTASGSWVLALDNVSTITEWLSDAVCRAVTGDGWLKRRLYSDSSMVVLSFRRCIILTTIDPGALRGDLGDRLVAIDLERITPHRRRTDTDLGAAWRAAHPRILGAVCDLAAQVLAVLPTVTLAEYPRLADFARIIAAVDQVLGTDGMGTYTAQGRRIAEDVIDSDRVATAMSTLVANRAEWTGTAAELLDELGRTLKDPDRPPKDWPGTARALAGHLRRATPALREVGIEVDHRREGHDRRRVIHVTRERTLFQPSAPSASGPAPLNPATSNGFSADGTADDHADGTDRGPQPSAVPSAGRGPLNPATSNGFDPAADGADGTDGDFPPISGGTPAVRTGPRSAPLPPPLGDDPDLDDDEDLVDLDVDQLDLTAAPDPAPFDPLEEPPDDDAEVDR